MLVLQEKELLLLFSLYFIFFWLFLPQKKSLLEVGSYLWMLTTVPHRRRVCLSSLVGATASDLGEFRWYKVSSVAAVHGQSCQSLLFEVSSAMSANCPAPLGWDLFDVKKQMEKEMYIKAFYAFVHTFGMVEVNSYHTVRKCHCQNWLGRRIILWIVGCYFEYFNWK